MVVGTNEDSGMVFKENVCDLPGPGYLGLFMYTKLMTSRYGTQEESPLLVVAGYPSSRTPPLSCLRLFSGCNRREPGVR